MENISQSEMGLGILSPESNDTTINVGNYVRVDVNGPDTGSVYQVMGLPLIIPPLPDPPVPAVQICNSPRSIIPITDVTRMDLVGEVQGPDVPIQKLCIKAEPGITMSVADFPDDNFDRPAIFPAPVEWTEFGDIGNLNKVLFQGLVSKQIFLKWKIPDA